MIIDRYNLMPKLQPIVEELGYEFVGMEFIGQGGEYATLRIYIDGPDGITVDDCGKVSREISAILDVEDPIPGNYHLEVSSPGLDRPLFFPKDFERFAGEEAKVKLSMPVQGARRFRGQLQGIQDNKVQMIVDGQQVEIPYDLINKANIIAKF